jgi:uncharacterized protein (TIGR00369 family)
VNTGGTATDRHFLNDLRLEAEVISESRARVRMPVTPHILGPDGGVRVGVLATLVDVVGGSAALRSLYPDWLATADLTIQSLRPARGPFVEARATVLRRGRTTLVVEALVVDVADDGSERVGVHGATGPAAWATMTFAILPGRAGVPMGNVSSDYPVRWSMSGAGLDAPVIDALRIGVENSATGQVVLPVREYLRNSFGAVQGGVMALLAEVAATEMLGSARASSDGPVVVDELQVTYLVLGRSGPIATRSRMLDAADESAGGRVVVELVDQGDRDRLTTVVNVRGRPVGSTPVGAEQ